MDSLLDTNIVSQRTKPRPDERVVRWVSSQPQSSLFLSVASLAEIRFGIENTQHGRRREGYEYWFRHVLLPGFSGRVLRIDATIAEEAGRMIFKATKGGRKAEFADALIAATARIHGLKIATLNRKHFERLGVQLVDF